MSSQFLPQRILVVGGALLATLLVAVYAYSTHSQMLLVGLPAFTVLVFLLSKSRFTYAAAIALSTSALTLPGLPSKVNLYLLMAAVSTVSLMAAAIITKKNVPSRPENKWVLALALLILATASIRGFGLRSLGGESWGGFSYITMLLACSFFLASTHIDVEEQTWRKTLTWMCLLSALPTLAQAVYAYSGGAIHHLFYFIVPEFQVLEFMFQREQGSSMARLQQANVTSQYFCILAFLILHRRSNRRWSVLLFGLALILAGISGNRIALVFIMLFIFFYLLTNQRLTLPQIVFHPAFLIAGVAIVFLGLLAPYLPLTFQRILSILPFANVSWEAKLAANSTINWRLEVWAAALRQVPDYLLVGKGFAFSAQDVMTLTARRLYMNDIDYVLASRNYHNGMLHTLLDLGLPGLIFSLGFIFTVIHRHWGLLGKSWTSPLMKHYHHVFIAIFMATALTYFVLAGGVTHLAMLFLFTMILEGLVRAELLERQREQARLTAATAPPAVPRFRAM
jgi:O-antigen ligase